MDEVEKTAARPTEGAGSAGRCRHRARRLDSRCSARRQLPRRRRLRPLPVGRRSGCGRVALGFPGDGSGRGPTNGPGRRLDIVDAYVLGASGWNAAVSRSRPRWDHQSATVDVDAAMTSSRSCYGAVSLRAEGRMRRLIRMPGSPPRLADGVRHAWPGRRRASAWYDVFVDDWRPMQLAAYQVELRFDNAQIVGIEGGEARGLPRAAELRPRRPCRQRPRSSWRR